MSQLILEQIKDELELRLLKESIPRIKSCLEQLSDKELWFSANNNSNAIGTLILHLCGNVRQYLVASIGGKPDVRNRMEEFTTRDVSRIDLIEQLNILSLEIEASIEKVNLNELERIRTVQGFEMSGTSIIIHVIEHFSYHTGQIAYLTKMLKDIDLKFYDGLDLNITGA